MGNGRPKVSQREIDGTGPASEALAKRASKLLGVEVNVDATIFDDSKTSPVDLSHLCRTAQQIGFERQEWTKEPQGGAWVMGLFPTRITIMDGHMLHAAPAESLSAEQATSVDVETAAFGLDEPKAIQEMAV